MLWPVRSEDHRALVIAGVDQLEEQIAAARHDREVTDLVDDKEGGKGEEPQALAQSGGDDVRERGERDALSRPLTSKAQMVRAILLANVTATTLTAVFAAWSESRAGLSSLACQA